VSAPESLRAHPGHDFEGFEILSQGDGERVLVARCDCGATLAEARAVFAPCPDCAGDSECPRCGSTGEVVDHASLAWRFPDDDEE
jgi:hypothetical protein